MKSLYYLLITIGLINLQGCSLAPTPEPLVTYQLTAATAKSPSLTSLPISLRINKPNASGYLTTNRLLVANEQNQLSLYKGAQWNEVTPLLIRNHLLDSFRQANLFGFVSNDDKRLMAEVELDSDLRTLQIEYDHPQPKVIIHLVARLVDANSKKILTTKSFSQTLSSPSNELNTVVATLNQAQNLLAQSIIEWSYQHLSQQK